MQSTVGPWSGQEGGGIEEIFEIFYDWYRQTRLSGCLMRQNRSQPLHRIELMSARTGRRESILEEEMLELNCDSTFIRQTDCKRGNYRRKQQSGQRGRRERVWCVISTQQSS